MKRIIKLVTLLSLIPATTFAISDYPKVYLEQGIALDHFFCPAKNSVTQESLQELDKLFPKFQTAWDNAADSLLPTVTRLLGPKFEGERKELTANLILCESLSSMSYPLFINMKSFLTTTQKSPYSIDYFVSIVFHELLHRYMYQYYRDINSALLDKYSNETITVLQHLHLMSVLKHVYLSLGKVNEFKMIVTLDSQLPDQSYKRAWEIVNKIEGHQAFITELKAYRF